MPRPVHDAGGRPACDRQGTQFAGGASSLLRASAAWSTPGGIAWVRVEGTGGEKFVENFTTAAVSKAPLGGGCEGFFCDVRGHVLAMAAILRVPADAGRPIVEIMMAAHDGAALAEHLERYHIREPIEIEDVSRRRKTVGLAGQGTADWLASRLDVPLPRDPFEHVHGHLVVDGSTSRLVSAKVLVMRIDWLEPEAFLLVVDETVAASLEAALTASGLPHATASDWDACRIEQGTPCQADITAKSLPQEFGRDARAISFTKGCYLGQETVARLDALGHVNRRFTGLSLADRTVPAAGSAIELNGEQVGVVTSACLSPRLGAGLALAIVPLRALATSPGSALTIGGVCAREVVLPLGKPS